MWDDLELLKKIDRSKMWKLLFDFPLQCRQAIRLGDNLPLFSQTPRQLKKTVVCGLGGSAIGGDILKTLLFQKLKIPIFINRNYGLPRLVDEETLVFIVSYSGNTEETLSAYEECKRRRAFLVSICSGGELKDLSKQDEVPCLIVPSGMPPRTTIGYLSIPMLRILERLKWVEPQNYGQLLQVLGEVRKRCRPEVPLSKNLAKSLAQELLGKIPLVYGVEGKTDVVAHRLKTQFNENSKILAAWDVFPELNHNEIVGWGGEGEIDLKRFYPIFIRDHSEAEKIKKRIEVTQSIIKKRKVKWAEIWTEGKNKLARVLSAIYIGDWVSFYLAIAQKVDPTPVKMIDFLKKELSKV
ncbi:MAG: bifunctional phosphoglucose/phosphomannose isomerase [bacterium]